MMEKGNSTLNVVGEESLLFYLRSMMHGYFDRPISDFFVLKLNLLLLLLLLFFIVGFVLFEKSMLD